MKKYRTILADPPWALHQVGNRGASRHYPVMSIADIAALRVQRLAADDAHLWMWATNSGLDQQIAVVEAWGFTYRAALTWMKPYFTLGNYLRHQTEHLLFCTRGRAPIQFRGQGTGSMRRSKNTATSPKSSTPSSSAARPVHTLSCSRVDRSPAGTSGATRSTATWRCDHFKLD